MKENTKMFFQAALIRAIRTGIQSFLSLVTVGCGLFDVDWKTIISVSLMSMLVSFLSAIATGLPEVSVNAGSFVIDNTDPANTRMHLQYSGVPEDLKPGDSVKFDVTEVNQNDGGIQ